jgi:hypothetical protein
MVPEYRVHYALQIRQQIPVPFVKKEQEIRFHCFIKPFIRG